MQQRAQPRICLRDSPSECHVSLLPLPLSDRAGGNKENVLRESALPQLSPTDPSRQQTSRLAIFFTFTQELRAAGLPSNKTLVKIQLEIDKICKSK